jgi:stage V sporulation protein B
MNRRVIHWTLAILPANLGARTLMMLDIWILKAMSKYPEAAGVYTVAYALSRLPMILIEGLCGAVFPKVSEALEQGNWEVAQTVSSDAMRFLIIFFMPICFIIAGCSGEIITFIFSSKYLDAAYSLRILCPAILFFGHLRLCWRLISATNRPQINLVVIYGLLGIAVVLNFLLIPRLGISGAAYASLFTFGIGAVTGTLLLYRFLKVLPPQRSAVCCGIAGLVVYFLGTIWHVSGWVLIAKLLILVLIYGIILSLLGELKIEDLKRIRKEFLNRSNNFPGAR